MFEIILEFPSEREQYVIKLNFSHSLTSLSMQNLESSKHTHQRNRQYAVLDVNNNAHFLHAASLAAGAGLTDTDGTFQFTFPSAALCNLCFHVKFNSTVDSVCPVQKVAN